MDVFSNFYLMQDICGLNCELDNLTCAKKELWYVLKLRIHPEQEIDVEIFYFTVKKGEFQFSEWLRLNNIKKITRFYEVIGNTGTNGPTITGFGGEWTGITGSTITGFGGKTINGWMSIGNGTPWPATPEDLWH